jgi:NADH dehydrogenase/NADH:ubiquinone oxidoreductase subunit G
MTQPANTDLITVNIDGREIAVPKGTNMIEAARMLGIDIPHYCYHPKLSVSGNCRMCLIEMGTPAFDRATKAPIMDPATGKQQIAWVPKPQIACFTNASPGLHVRTDTPLIRECREGVTEFLLVNHPLDCPICDQAGECKIQEQATQHGAAIRASSRRKTSNQAHRHRPARHARRRALRAVLALHPLLQGSRQGRRARLHRPRQLHHDLLLSGPPAR